MLTASAPIVTTALPPIIAASSFTVPVFFESIVELPFMAVADSPLRRGEPRKVQVTTSELAFSVVRLEAGLELASRAAARVVGRTARHLLPCAHACCRTPPMTRFLARRLGNYVLLLILASFLTFTLTSIS